MMIFFIFYFIYLNILQIIIRKKELIEKMI